MCTHKVLAGILTLFFTRDLVGLCRRQVFNSNNKKILNGTLGEACVVTKFKKE